MTANLAFFAVHADDVDRARRFYEAVFGWRFEPWGPPEFYLIHTGDAERPGVGGALQRRSAPRPAGRGITGVEPTFAVADLAAVAAAVAAHGGRVTYPATAIPGVGVLLRFDDPEGNDMGAMIYEREPSGQR